MVRGLESYNNFKIGQSYSQEQFFDLWAADALRAGIIKKCDKPVAIVLSDEIYEESRFYRTIYKGTKREQKKLETKKHILYKPCTYTADRFIIWNTQYKGVLFDDQNDFKSNKCYFKAKRYTKGNQVMWISHIDVKSPFKGINRSDVSFGVKRKWIWQRYKIYINEVINYPIKFKKSQGLYLWPSTFTPSRYFWTDGLTAKRTISKWNTKSVNDLVLK